MVRKIAVIFVWFIAVSLVLTAIGAVFPIVILGAIALVVLAYKKPAIVTRVSESRYVARVPALIRATPTRFAIVTAAVLIPLAAVAGSAVYAPDDAGGLADTQVAAIVAPVEEVEAEENPINVTVAEPTVTPEPTVTTEPSSTPESTSTPEPPTVTPEPTSTPEPPATPEPTSTPQPTATPEPTVAPPTATPETSADEQVYVDTIIGQSERLGESFQTFGELLGDFDLFDEGWRLGVAWEIGVWRALYVEAQGLTPPTGYEAFHAKWLETLGKVDAASHDYANGIDNIDASLIESGTAKILEANTLLDEALTLFQEAQGQ